MLLEEWNNKSSRRALCEMCVCVRDMSGQLLGFCVEKSVPAFCVNFCLGL